MPACGVVAGILAAADAHGVWHRMPLSDSALKGQLAPVLDLAAKDVSLLNRVGVNTLVRAHAGGAALVGNVTFAGAKAVSGLWQRLDTRRTALLVVRSIEEHTRWGLNARPSELKAALVRQVWAFLARLHREGALVGKNADEAFFVRMTQMPGRETIVLKVGLALWRPGDFVIYEFRYRDRPGLAPAIAADATELRSASSGAP
jgi:phage tail sheath protein FI